MTRDGIMHEIETISGRWSFDKIVNNCVAANKRHGPNMFGVEYVAFQKALGDTLIKLGISVHPIRADIDKVRRAIAVTGPFENNKVRINNQKMVKQMIEFPKGSHDDYVDAAVHAIKLINQYGKNNIKQIIEKAKEIKMPFGKYRNRLVSDIVKEDKEYIKWLVNKSDSKYLKQVIYVLMKEENPKVKRYNAINYGPAILGKSCEICVYSKTNAGVS